MGEMRKTSPELCKKCKHNYGQISLQGHVYIGCRYVLNTTHSRGCKYGECDKFEKGKPKTEDDRKTPQPIRKN